MAENLWARISPLEQEIVDRYRQERPVRVGQMAADLGLEVVRAALDPKVSGLIRPSLTARSGFEIRVNKYETKERQRFTVAHEIAHYLLHRNDIGSGVVDSIMYRSALTSKKEIEANKLAAAIVMPYSLIQREVAGLRGLAADVVAERLAASFGVSVPAMKVRLGIA